jgi:hypothetical protein
VEKPQTLTPRKPRTASSAVAAVALRRLRGDAFAFAPPKSADIASEIRGSTTHTRAGRPTSAHATRAQAHTPGPGV